MLFTKEIFAFLSIAITIIAYVPYFNSIYKGECRPHAFSWFIWFALTFIAFLLQYSENGGLGAFATLTVAMICFMVSVAGFFVSKQDIKRIDYIALISAFLILPIWYLTNDPLLSVMIVVLIDLIGYFPTFRKAFSKPNEEQILTFFILALSNALTALAMEEPNVINLMFPLYLLVLNIILPLYVFWRRRVLLQVSANPIAYNSSYK